MVRLKHLLLFSVLLSGNVAADSYTVHGTTKQTHHEKPLPIAYTFESRDAALTRYHVLKNKSWMGYVCIHNDKTPNDETCSHAKKPQ